jgi:hypothetical protein
MIEPHLTDILEPTTAVRPGSGLRTIGSGSPALIPLILLSFLAWQNLYSLEVIEETRSLLDIDKTSAELAGRKLCELYTIVTVHIERPGIPAMTHPEVKELVEKLEYLSFNPQQPPINASWGPSLNGAHHLVLLDQGKVIGAVILFRDKITDPIGIFLHYENGHQVHSLVGVGRP